MSNCNKSGPQCFKCVTDKMLATNNPVTKRSYKDILKGRVERESVEFHKEAVDGGN